MSLSTPLATELARLIAAEGPLPLSRYMAEALGHPRYGYYTTKEPFGVRGDFVTAPEISQMFGELIGLWCAQTWADMGGPEGALLVELGPGRGTLMADALRAAAALPLFRDSLAVHLVETSPRLRERQREALSGIEVAWHDSIDDLPPGPAFIIANEFFDALPIRQFQRDEDGWHECMVGLADNELALLRSPAAVPDALIPPALRAAPTGSIAELSPAREEAMRQIAARLADQGGAALVIDYGHAQSGPGDTLQAVRAHEPVPVLSAPGEVDLTAHVDFQALAEVATGAGAATYGPVAQGDWLLRIGLAQRAAALKARATAAQAEAIDAAVARLTETEQMGTLFKVLAIIGPSSRSRPQRRGEVDRADRPDQAWPAGFERTT